MPNVDELLYEALSPTENPDPMLDQKIIAKIKEQDMKKRKNMEPINDTAQYEDTRQADRRRRTSAAAVIAAGVVALSSVTAVAAWKYHSAREVASNLDNPGLAGAFESAEATGTPETVSCGGCDVSFLGIVSGKNLSSFLSTENGVVIDDMTYAVVAIANSDGTPMPDTSSEDYDLGDFLASPYIEGYNPAVYNIFSLAGGGASEYVQDGVRYRLIETENIEAFADRTIYLGVTDGTFYKNGALLYDEASGALRPNPEYTGVNALFTLPIDPSKADPKKAAEIVARIEHPDSDASDEPGAPGRAEALQQSDSDSSESEQSAIIPEDVEAWMARLTPENIDEYARPLESTRQTVTPAADGSVHITWKLPDGRGTDATTTLDTQFPDGKTGMSKYFAYSLSEDGFSSLVIDTYTLNEDGTVTYVAYVPKAAE